MSSKPSSLVPRVLRECHGFYVALFTEVNLTSYYNGWYVIYDGT